MSGEQKTNTLHYGDCLDILKAMPAESVDLIYLDPPFNSNANYNMLFGSESGEDKAQLQAFNDTWYWRPEYEDIYDNLLTRGGTFGDTAEALRTILGPCGMLAYLLFMMERLVEMRRVLKNTGSIYLHCDTSAVHYLKIMMDSVFGGNAYRNHITWRRATSHNNARRFGRISDCILFFTKSKSFTWNGESVRLARRKGNTQAAYPSKDDRGRYRSDNLTGPHGQTVGESAKPWGGYDVASRGRIWAVPKTSDYAEYIDAHFIPGYLAIEGIHDRLDALDEAGLIHHPETGFWPGLKRYAEADAGTPVQDIILEPTGFTNYSTKNKEYLNYPTQKPLGLLKPLIELSSNEGDVVLDPFCGCGTTVDAAEALGRCWIGVDVSALSIDVILERLSNVHGKSILKSIEVKGIPRDVEGANKLFTKSPFEFERWAVGLVRGRPNDKQTGDGGSDGTLFFPSSTKGKPQRGIISVKGGKTVNPGMVRDLFGAVEKARASMGVLITLEEPTRGMLDTANQYGQWEDNFTQNKFPRIQIITVGELLEGRKLDAPTQLSPYTKAEYKHNGNNQEDML